jgi:hypothetical protein
MTDILPPNAVAAAGFIARISFNEVMVFIVHALPAVFVVVAMMFVVKVIRNPWSTK